VSAQPKKTLAAHVEENIIPAVVKTRTKGGASHVRVLTMPAGTETALSSTGDAT